MIKAVIIDDEPDSILTLELDLAKYCPQVTVVKIFSSAKEGLLYLKNESPDLLFLDIELGEMTGFDLLDSFGECSFNIIFVTAYDEFAIRAFEVAAIGYLLKPFDKHQLISAVQRVEKRLFSHAPSYQVLLENLRNSNNEKLIVPMEKSLEIVHIPDIIYLKSENNYTRVYLAQNEELFSSKSLKKFELLLTPAGFFRCHNSYLINLRQVRRLIKGIDERLIMTNGHEVYVSRNKRNDLLNLF